jgi:hypothetical protein
MMMQDYQRPRPYSVPAGIPSSLMRQQFLPNTQQNLSQQQHQQFFNNYQSPETPPAGFQHPTTFPFNPTNFSASYLDQRYKSHPYITATRYQQMMSSSNSVSNNDFNNNSNNNNFSTASATAINTTDNTTEVGPIRHSYGSSNARDGGYNQYSSAASVDPRLYFDDLIKPSSASGWQSEQTNNTITSTQSTAPLLLKKFESSSILPTPDALPTSPNQQADSGVNVASGLLAETKINDGKRQQSSSTNDLKFILNASSSPISPQARGSESDYSSDVTI